MSPGPLAPQATPLTTRPWLLVFRPRAQVNFSDPEECGDFKTDSLRWLIAFRSLSVGDELAATQF